MAGFAIWVVFDLKPGARDNFLEAVNVNASASVRDEPGCSRFDVLVPRDGANRVALYEIYDSEDAFQDHLKTRHFRVFDEAVDPLVESRSIAQYDVVHIG